MADGKGVPGGVARAAVAAVVAAGRPQAALFGVGLATLTRWLGRWRGGQALQAEQSRHGPPLARFADPSAWRALRAQLAATPDARLADHGRRWHKATGQRVGAATLWRAWRALGWTRKKALRERRARRGRASQADWTPSKSSA